MKNVIISLLFLSLSACESVEKWTQIDRQPVNQAVVTHDETVNPSKDMPKAQYFDENGSYIHDEKYNALKLSSGVNKRFAMGKQRNINHYIRGITHDLIENLTYVNEQTPLAIASFVLMDKELNKAGILGKQMAESFAHEIYKFGIPVIDFKTTDFLRVTPEGDFILSRDFLELKPNLPMEYILLGTLVKHESGYLVNARIVGLQSKAIVASAQGFLPEDITHAIQGSEKKSNFTLE
ncbi:FlgO family outer membrane protein [Pseudoalteromonas denitrificans]|uniref:FlgO domain-containing protein n=1 Tax=Pseudoalteromonas denitrificans DSM 6059 TaxID=1123010 RepID=A0A1I1HVH6_9GAMM|nr:FlgO family outer membrane protein [Pseudoalteromonas denitrificans]SFC25958.1 hypothetical protein SAMN02745724_01291 [Pseudoalteromonas denitrificans DSM 6059]